MRRLCPILLLSLVSASSATAAPIVFDDGGVHDYSGSTDQGVIVRSDTTLNVLEGASLTGTGASCAFGAVGALCMEDATAKILGGEVDSVSGYGQLHVMGGSVRSVVAGGGITVSGGAVTTLYLVNGLLEVRHGDPGVPVRRHGTLQHHRGFGRLAGRILR